MKCPECKAKISQKHYDPLYQWYECPKCEGCFTPDEILESELSSNPVRAPKEALSDKRRTSIQPVAKGKVRRAAQESDEELEDKLTKEVSQAVRRASDVSVKHRDSLPSSQVVPIIADEIQEIYRDLGGEIDLINAQDKALTIFRDLAYAGHVTFRDQPVEMSLCKEHE